MIEGDWHGITRRTMFCFYFGRCVVWWRFPKWGSCGGGSDSEARTVEIWLLPVHFLWHQKRRKAVTGVAIVL